MPNNTTNEFGQNKPSAEEPDFNVGMDEDRARRILERRAKKVSEEDVEKLTTTLKEKVKDLKVLEDGLHWIGTLIGRAKLLFAMVRDKEFHIDTTSKVLVIAGLLYFVVPTDMMPDFIPGIGYIDDAFVLGTLWNLVAKELDRYVDYLEDVKREDESLDTLAFGGAEPQPPIH